MNNVPSGLTVTIIAMWGHSQTKLILDVLNRWPQRRAGILRMMVFWWVHTLPGEMRTSH